LPTLHTPKPQPRRRQPQHDKSQSHFDCVRCITIRLTPNYQLPITKYNSLLNSYHSALTPQHQYHPLSPCLLFPITNYELPITTSLPTLSSPPPSHKSLAQPRFPRSIPMTHDLFLKSFPLASPQFRSYI